MAVVPASTGNTERQIQHIQDLGVPAMAANPSYMMYVGEVAERIGISIKDDTKLRVGLLGAEPWSDRMGDPIQDWLRVKGINCYGTSEHNRLGHRLVLRVRDQEGKAGLRLRG